MRRGGGVLRSMPLRLTLGLVALFTTVSLISLAATYVVTQASFDQALRDDLKQDMAGFRAAPNAAALAALVKAEARETDPDRMVLSYFAPNRRHYGNAVIARDSDGYRIVTPDQTEARTGGAYLALTSSEFGGQLTIARSRAEIDALRGVFLNILALSLLPTVLIALSGGLYLARRGATHVRVVSRALDRLTTGDLAARVGPVVGWSDDLAQIGGKIDQMAQAQERSVAAIKQVSSDIAHDLKTPIQRVAVHLDDLSRSKTLAPAVGSRIDKARTELEGVASVFRSLLQIAQIETGSPAARFAPLDLRDVASRCAELYEPTASDSGHGLHIDLGPAGAVPATVTGDRDLLMQLLANLIENALRHTPPGTNIHLSLTAASGSVVLCVRDTGPGIPAADRNKVLQRLYRLDRSRRTPGNGLGLSFVSVVARLHDADLSLTDAAPGLCVCLTFAAYAGQDSGG
ncbi:sensor histidine kinase [Sulfitobacter sabulilitoris]|uniref:histidine kinase n=1 Tax=Sulfitobacter sabulilitoris TaxID=2562655 RepID=A0A5S3Q437_9RHOB|nr:HAMP domain-containing sensor histidine kinase [Sulfitobacter sabulilitoris]TMM51291.1 HAMP domain-containing histidine kinase [Sulfitobacter sabulilitoris]